MFNQTVHKWFSLGIGVMLVWAIWALAEMDVWAAVVIGGLIMVASLDFLGRGLKPMFVAVLVSPLIGILLYFALKTI